jgi:hypothetical protein
MASEGYPTAPLLEVTPGDLCKTPQEFRYPEHIAYCGRDVSRRTKDEVIKAYEELLGPFVQRLGRENFKIDHFIPLCMGGSNDPENLWPQYEAIYARTDGIERSLCKRLESGSITHAEAVTIVRDVKIRIDRVDDTLRSLNLQR